MGRSVVGGRSKQKSFDIDSSLFRSFSNLSIIFSFPSITFSLMISLFVEDFISSLISFEISVINCESHR